MATSKIKSPKSRGDFSQKIDIVSEGVTNYDSISNSLEVEKDSFVRLQTWGTTQNGAQIMSVLPSGGDAFTLVRTNQTTDFQVSVFIPKGARLYAQNVVGTKINVTLIPIVSI